MTNLQTRVKGILVNPSAEWLAIAAEPDDVAAIYRNYIVFLAAIPAISVFLGLTIFGVPLFGRSGISTAVPALMKTPYDKVVPFIVVAALVIVVLNIVLRSIVAVFGFPTYGV